MIINENLPIGGFFISLIMLNTSNKKKWFIADESLPTFFENIPLYRTGGDSSGKKLAYRN